MSQNDLVIANQSFPSFRTDLNSALQAINSSHSGSSIPSGAVAGTIWLDTTSATSPTLKFYDGTDSISLAIIDYTNNTVNWLDSSISYNTTATSAGTLTLTVASSYKQFLTGTTTHTVVLPVTSTLTLGQTFQIHNNSTGSVTINSSGANLVGTLVADTTAEITCILTSGTTAASWDYYSISSTSLATPLAVVGNATSGSEIRLPEDTDNGANYVAIKAPDTIASNLTFTLPVAPTVNNQSLISTTAGVMAFTPYTFPTSDGTASQVLQTNGSGVLSFASVSASAGQVIQVLSATDSTARSTTSTSFVTASNTLSVTITPASASNKILILANVSSISGIEVDATNYITIFRGATNLGQATYGFANTNSASAKNGAAMMFLDSPSTTSATTYQVYTRLASSGTNQINYQGATSTITCLEIKG